MTATRADPSLPLAPEWYQRIAEAMTSRDLVMVVRNFLDTWSPVDLAKLPLAARPGRVVDADDIASMAYDLAQERLRGGLPPDIDRLATRMHTFFSHAAARAALLSAHRTLP
jgi:hypothetical protein